MNRRLLALILSAVSGLFALPAHAGGKPGEAPSVSFHLETDPNDNPKLIFPLGMSDGKKHFFRRLPDISMKDVRDFAPFPSSDGSSLGVLFRLKPGATNRLAALTAANPEKWIVSLVNGRPVDAMLIDKTVSDGQIVVWRGITPAEVAQYEKQVPRIGAPDKKKKK